MNSSSTSRAHRLLVSAAVAALLGAGIAGCQQEIISSAPAARQQGMKEFGEGNYADAAGSFRNALRSDPRDYKSQFYLAQSYEQMHQYQQAIQAYKASLDAQPRTLAGQEDQAQRLRTTEALAGVIAKSDESDAETNVAEQKAKSSNQPQDYLLLAKIYQNRGDADSAIDAYNRAFLIDKNDFVVTKEYGLYLAQLGQNQKAEQTLRKAYTLNQNDEQVNAALRKLNIIPGPGLKDESALVKPPIPQGPLPELDLSKMGLGGGGQSSSAQPAAATAQPSQVPPPPTADSIPQADQRAVSQPRD
jgi:tetratricopeptide (TPR) repeat protein